MKSGLGRIVLLGFLAVLVQLNANAQRGGRKPNPADTSKKQQVTTNNNAVPAYNPYANVPIIVDSSGFTTNDRRPSLRADNAYDKKSLTDRTPLPYEHIRWDDAFYAEKVWRELDLREKMNLPFRYEAEDDNGSQMFIDILMKAVTNSDINKRVTVFDDDRFAIPLSIDEVNKKIAGKNDTIPIYDPNDITRLMHYKVVKANFDPKTVNKIAIKEEWIFDRESSRLVCRILGIAPLLTKYLPSGQEMGQSVMFWVHYPDLRPTLAKYEVYNAKNMGQNRMTWEELFESRMFSSYIIKSTLDNPTFKPIRVLMPGKDILALLEGENIKEKI